jgi:tetratricopeptide (TPR) repeat protein
MICIHLRLTDKLKFITINSIIFYIFLWILDNSSFTKVNIRNQATEDAQKAYLQGNYSEAVSQYQLMSRQSFFTPPEVTLNLANSLFEVRDTLAARKKYAQLVSLKEPLLASTTYSQLGIILVTETDTAKALALFKEALILKPDNEIARFNYELLKRWYHPRQNKTHTESNTPINKQMPQRQTQQEQKEIEKNKSQKELLKTLKNYGLTPEKATTILDGMKNSEVQYIQQQKNLVKSTDSRITKNW